MADQTGMTLMGAGTPVAILQKDVPFLYPALVNMDLSSQDPKAEFSNYMALAFRCLAMRDEL